MKIEYLETVLKVADCGSFKQAAKLSPCSQSSVSKQIKSVEQELGTVLFHRSSNMNMVELTDEGTKALPIIRQIVEYNNTLQSTVRQKPRNKVKKVLRVSLDGNFMGSAATSRLISELYEKYPEIQLSVVRCEYAKGIELLKKDKIDAIFTFQNQWDHQMPDIFPPNSVEFETIPVGTEPLYIMLGEHNQHIKSDELKFKDLRKLVFLFGVSLEELEEEVDKKKGPIYGSFLKACRKCGFIPQIRKVDVLPVDTNLADVKEYMVAKGNEAAILTVPKKIRSTKGVRYLPVMDAPYSPNYYLIIKASARTGGLREFEAFLKSLF